jgi:hypothetical protein
VFASRAFCAGDVVEIAPVVVIPVPEITETTRRLRPTSTTIRPAPYIKVVVEFVREFQVLVYHWDHLANVPGTRALALGYGSLYNSANPANMRYEADASQHVMRFIAHRDIHANEELTINYDGEGGVEWQDHNWFVENRIEFHP